MLAVEWGTGQVVWSLLWLFLIVIWIWLIIVLFSDIIRSQDLSGWGKALWALLIIFFTFIGIFAYLIVRGGGMAERANQQVRDSNEATQAYLRDAASVGSDADQLDKLAQLHSAGKLDDTEYAAAKAKIIN